MYLLTETDKGPSVEREEDERVRNEALLHALVDEPLRVTIVLHNRHENRGAASRL